VAQIKAGMSKIGMEMRFDPRLASQRHPNAPNHTPRPHGGNMSETVDET